MDQDLRTVLRAINTGILDIRNVIESLKGHLSDSALFDLFNEVTNEIAKRDYTNLGQSIVYNGGKEAPWSAARRSTPGSVWLAQISRDNLGYFETGPLFQEVTLSRLRAYQVIKNFLLVHHSNDVITSPEEVNEDIPIAPITIGTAFNQISEEARMTIIKGGGNVAQNPARLELEILERAFGAMMTLVDCNLRFTVTKIEVDPNFGASSLDLSF